MLEACAPDNLSMRYVILNLLILGLLTSCGDKEIEEVRTASNEPKSEDAEVQVEKSQGLDNETEKHNTGLFSESAIDGSTSEDCLENCESSTTKGTDGETTTQEEDRSHLKPPGTLIGEWRLYKFTTNIGESECNSKPQECQSNAVRFERGKIFGSNKCYCQ